MEKLPNINLDRKTINMMFMSRIAEGGEAVICRGFKPNSLIKIFVKPESSEYSDSFRVPLYPDLITMPENKLSKLEVIHQSGLEHSVLPLCTITMHKRLVGYEMTYDPNDKQLNGQNLSREELIHFLEQSKAILEYYKEHDIVYGDVNANNLLINRKTGQVKFCDIDNIKIGEYPIDVMGRDLNIYTILHGLDSSADAYMHNVMTLHQLRKDRFGMIFEPVSWLVKKDFSKDLTNDAKEVLESMREPKNFNGEYVIQYIKK